MAQNPDGGGYEIPLLASGHPLKTLIFKLNKKMSCRLFYRLIGAFIRCKKVLSVSLIVPREVILKLCQRAD